MNPADTLEKTLCRLVAATEELERLLEQRDPRYLEALDRRGALLKELAERLPEASAPPSARAALERVRQLGEACQRQAMSLRLEAAGALALLEHDLMYAESLRRLTGPRRGDILDMQG